MTIIRRPFLGAIMGNNLISQLKYIGGHLWAVNPLPFISMKPLERARYIHTSLFDLNKLSYKEYLKEDVAKTLITRLSLTDGPSRININKLNIFSDIMKAKVFASAKFSGVAEQNYIIDFLGTINPEQVSVLLEFRSMLWNLASYKASPKAKGNVSVIALDLLSKKKNGLTAKDAEEILLMEPSDEMFEKLSSLDLFPKMENLVAVARYIDRAIKKNDIGGQGYAFSDIDRAMELFTPFKKKRKVLLGELSAINPALAQLITSRLNDLPL